MRMPFGQFAPDLGSSTPEGMEVALNVYGKADGYSPMPSPAILSSALPSRIYGFASAVTADGTVVSFAATATGLYKLDTSTNTWANVDRTVGGAYTGDTTYGWDFALYGNRIIAVNENDNPQYYDIGVSTNFENLPGNPPRARHVACIGEFVVLYALNGNPRKMQWSEISNSEGWRIGINSGDEQEFPQGGELKFMGTYQGGAIVLQQNAIRWMEFLPGSALIFSFTTIAGNQGCLTHNSCTQLSDRVYFVSYQGIYYVDKTGSLVPIGQERVDNYFLGIANTNDPLNFQAAVDVLRGNIIWRYSTEGQEYSDRCLIYNYHSDKFSEMEVNMEWMSFGFSIGISMDSMDSLYPDLDALTISLDSTVWRGGAPLLVSFDSDYKMQYHNGANMEATLQTYDMSLADGYECSLRAFRPIVEADTCFGQVGTRTGYKRPLTWKLEKQMRASGRINSRARGYTHRFQLRIPEDTEWETAIGIDVLPEEMEVLGHV